MVLGAKPKYLAMGMYIFLQMCALVGIFIYGFTIIATVQYYDLVLTEGGIVQGVLRSVSTRFPNLGTVSWHTPEAIGNVGLYYLRSIIFLIVVFVLQTILTPALWRGLVRLSRWCLSGEHRNQKLLIVGSVGFLILCFEMRIISGFFYPGISAWTYHNARFETLEQLPTEALANQPLSDADVATFRQALNQQNVKYLPMPGYYSLRVFFLSFADGQMLPGSFDLTEMPNPSYTYGPFRDPQVFFDGVQLSVAQRNQNRRFLLPMRVTYPNHVPFYPIPVDYPPAESLTAISFWELYMYVDGDQVIEIISAIHQETIFAE